MRVAMALVGAFLTCGCNPFGPSCLDRQTRGTVTTFTGEVGAGQVVSRVVPYGTDGSQNDVHISWPGQNSETGPRLNVYATRVGCITFVPPDGSGMSSGDCLQIGGRGGNRLPSGDFVQNSLIVTNGRGNPDILGPQAEYKLWIVGDASRQVTYTIDITWFFGPDC